MAILQSTDFTTGATSIPQDSFVNLTPYITEFEQLYLLKLLGADLYTLFIADLTAPTPQTPQTLIYQSLFNPFFYNDNGCEVKSEGIKKLLVEFVYFHYMRDNVYQKTKSGVVMANNELSSNLGYKFNLEEQYNKGVDNIKAIQSFIEKNIADYPTFNRQPIYYVNGI